MAFLIRAVSIASVLIKRLFHGEEQVVGHVNGRGLGFDLDEKDMVAVDDDLSTFVDSAQLYQGHNFAHFAQVWTLIKPLPRPRLRRFELDTSTDLETAYYIASARARSGPRTYASGRLLRPQNGG
jgi:hypothetical protein